MFQIHKYPCLIKFIKKDPTTFWFRITVIVNLFKIFDQNIILFYKILYQNI